jgi:hypothetical protein
VSRTRPEAGWSEGDAFQDAAIEYLERSLAGGDFPHMSALLEGATVRERIAEMTSDEPGRFERALIRLLDGIALEIDR